MISLYTLASMEDSLDLSSKLEGVHSWKLEFNLINMLELVTLYQLQIANAFSLLVSLVILNKLLLMIEIQDKLRLP